MNVTYEKKKFDSKSLEDKLYKDIEKQVNKYNFLSIKESGRDYIYTDSGILLKITYICEENIAVQDKILLSKVN